MHPRQRHALQCHETLWALMQAVLMCCGCTVGSSIAEQQPDGQSQHVAIGPARAQVKAEQMLLSGCHERLSTVLAWLVKCLHMEPPPASS